MSSLAHVGIDLGTTNSLIAVFRDGAPQLVKNAHGDVLTPSVVGVLPSGEVVVGQAARELALTEPERTVAAFKRWMGTDRKVEIAGRTFDAPELSSLVLAALKRDAESEFGVPVRNVVITVPAYFNQLQRAATKRAGELAGLVVDRMVNEPTAAALTYGLHRRDENQRLVVFDLGGGTFDVTVMEIFEGSLEILGTAGESRLGGEDFTEALLGEALKQMGRNLELVEMQEPLLVSRLRSEAEKAKREIGVSEVGRMRLPDASGSVDSTSRVFEVNAARFEDLVEPLLDRIRRPTLRALNDARMTPGAVDEVILVGGATRMPAVRRLANEMFDREPRDEVHPDQAVALGAAIQAALIADDEGVSDMVMTDVCPHTLGVEIVKEFGSRQIEGYFLPVIHRNTTIPVSREESVSTVRDGQTVINVRVFQGEARRVEDNLLLGELEVSGLPERPRGLEVILRFTYDLNGLLEVDALVPITGERHSTVLRQGAGEMSDEEVRAALEKMQALKVYPREQLENQRLLAFSNAAVKEVDMHKRSVLESAIDLYEHWLHQNDGEQFRHARETLLETLTALGVPYPEAGS